MIAGWATKWHPNWHRTAGYGKTSSGRKYVGGQPESSETLTIGDAGTWGGSDAHALANRRLQPLGHPSGGAGSGRPAAAASPPTQCSASPAPLVPGKASPASS